MSDTNTSPVFSTLGLALSQWQFVEDELSLIFAALIGAKRPEPALAAINSVVNFGIRLSMVDSVVPISKRSKTLRAEWKPLKNRLNKRSAKRNQIVHFQLIQNPDAKNLSESAFLQPSLLDPGIKKKYGGIEKIPRISIKQIKDAGESFAKLASDLKTYRKKLESG